MAYLSRCILRLSNPSVFRKLSSLGLQSDPFGQYLKTGKGFDTIVCEGFFSTIPSGVDSEGFYDCEENIDLFMALSALSDSTDYGQWVVYEDGLEEEWIKCQYEDAADLLYESGVKGSVRKADKYELIDHFTLL